MLTLIAPVPSAASLAEGASAIATIVDSLQWTHVVLLALFFFRKALTRFIVSLSQRLVKFKVTKAGVELETRQLEILIQPPEAVPPIAALTTEKQLTAPRRVSRRAPTRP